MPLKLGFDLIVKIALFMTYIDELDLPIPQLLHIAKATNSALCLGLDVDGETETFATRMKLYNVIVVMTTTNLGGLYNKVVALRGLGPLHMPLQQRFLVFDAVIDLVHCGHVVNRWIPLMVMEFLLYNVDRVLKVGGYLWYGGILRERERKKKNPTMITCESRDHYSVSQNYFD
jgi:SAM-dependent methyltransferase